MKFKLESDFKPTGDQPEAIKQLVAGIECSQMILLASVRMSPVFLDDFMDFENYEVMCENRLTVGPTGTDEQLMNFPNWKKL